MPPDSPLQTLKAAVAARDKLDRERAKAEDAVTAAVVECFRHWATSPAEVAAVLGLTRATFYRRYGSHNPHGYNRWRK
jgi:transcriptional regulator of acetoin/glycerol metabolism